jgi:hypothetical protein
VDKWEFSLLELGCLYKVWLAYKCLRLVERLKVEWLGLMIGLMIGIEGSVLKTDWSAFRLLIFILANGIKEFLTFYFQLEFDWS